MDTHADAAGFSACSSKAVGLRFPHQFIDRELRMAGHGPNQARPSTTTLSKCSTAEWGACFRCMDHWNEMCSYGPIPRYFGITGKKVSKAMKWSGYSNIEGSVRQCWLSHARPLLTETHVAATPIVRNRTGSRRGVRWCLTLT